MVKKCNGQDIFLKTEYSGGNGAGSKSSWTPSVSSARSYGGSMRAWGDNRSRSPPHYEMSGVDSKADPDFFGGRKGYPDSSGKGDAYGKGKGGGYSDPFGKGFFDGKGYKGFGKGKDDYLFGGVSEFDIGYWAGVQKGMSKADSLRSVYANFGGDRKAAKGDRKGDRKGKSGGFGGKSESRRGGKGWGGKDEPSSMELDDELSKYFGGKAGKSAKEEPKGKGDEPSGEDLDKQIDGYMADEREDSKEKEAPEKPAEAERATETDGEKEKSAETEKSDKA